MLGLRALKFLVIRCAATEVNPLVLYRRTEIPEQLLQQDRDGGHLYGGGARMGYLLDNGEVDFVVFQIAGI